MGTTAEQIMGAQGSDVVTIRPEATLAQVAELLHERGIGALVVLEADGRVAGVVSERDVVRHMATEGTDCLEVSVAEAMTGTVSTCTAATPTDELMRLMTDGRFRHVPVVDDAGGLFGIVSIGDVVKSRIDQLQVEKESLTEYVTGSY